jgi:hypothetical protein
MIKRVVTDTSDNVGKKQNKLITLEEKLIVTGRQKLYHNKINILSSTGIRKSTSRIIRKEADKVKDR